MGARKAAALERRPVAVHLQVGRSHAGSALGHRRDGGQRESTRGAIIPAAVGVDIGCGMMAVQTSLHADHFAGQSARQVDVVHTLRQVVCVKG